MKTEYLDELIAGPQNGADFMRSNTILVFVVNPLRDLHKGESGKDRLKAHAKDRLDKIVAAYTKDGLEGSSLVKKVKERFWKDFHLLCANMLGVNVENEIMRHTNWKNQSNEFESAEDPFVLIKSLDRVCNFVVNQANRQYSNYVSTIQSYLELNPERTLLAFSHVDLLTIEQRGRIVEGAANTLKIEKHRIIAGPFAYFKFDDEGWRPDPESNLDEITVLLESYGGAVNTFTNLLLHRNSQKITSNESKYLAFGPIRLLASLGDYTVSFIYAWPFVICFWLIISFLVGTFWHGRDWTFWSLYQEFGFSTYLASVATTLLILPYVPMHPWYPFRAFKWSRYFSYDNACRWHIDRRQGIGIWENNNITPSNDYLKLPDGFDKIFYSQGPISKPLNCAWADCVDVNSNTVDFKLIPEFKRYKQYFGRGANITAPKLNRRSWIFIGELIALVLTLILLVAALFALVTSDSQSLESPASVDEVEETTPNEDASKEADSQDSESKDQASQGAPNGQ